MKNNKISRKFIIYCDMDGVLVDFVSIAMEKMNLSSNLKTKLAKKALQSLNKLKFEPNDLIFDTALEETKNYLFYLVKNDRNIWANLPWIHDGKKLHKFLIRNNKKMNAHIKILSAPIDKECEIGKLLWIMKNFVNFLSKEWKFSFLLNDVVFDREKHLYAHPNSILIDDSKINIDLFTQHGGIGIFHTNSEDTIQTLKSIIKI